MEKKANWMVKVTWLNCNGEMAVREMTAETYEAATRAWERIMKRVRTLTTFPEHLTVSMSAIGGAFFTHHFAEYSGATCWVDKMNWEYDDWLDW